MLVQQKWSDSGSACDENCPSAELGNAIPDRFANPGISGLSLLNPGIPGLIPGLNRARLWLAIAGLVVCNRQNSNNKDYKVYVEQRNAHSNRAVKLHVSSLASRTRTCIIALK